MLKNLNIMRWRDYKIITIIIFITLCIFFIGSEFYLRNVYHLGSPVIYQSSPLFGYRPQPNQSLERFYGAHLSFNNLGLRASDNWDQEIEHKVLFLGDSVTYGGSYIDDKELFTSIIQNQYPNYQMGNGGVNAWGVPHIYGLVIESNFQPAKTYVTVLIENDFYRPLSSQFGWRNKPKFAWTELTVHYLSLWLYGIKFTPASSLFHNDHGPLMLKKSVQLLQDMDQHLKAKGFNHIVFISPKKDQVLGHLKEDKLLLEELSKTQIKVVNLLSHPDINSLSEETIDDIFHDAAHLNKKGHQLWGKIIGQYLDQNGLLD